MPERKSTDSTLKKVERLLNISVLTNEFGLIATRVYLKNGHIHIMFDDGSSELFNLVDLYDGEDIITQQGEILANTDD